MLNVSYEIKLMDWYSTISATKSLLKPVHMHTVLSIFKISLLYDILCRTERKGIQRDNAYNKTI